MRAIQSLTEGTIYEDHFLIKEGILAVECLKLMHSLNYHWESRGLIRIKS